MITPGSSIRSNKNESNEPVPLELVYLLMRKWKREDYVKKLIMNLLFVTLYCFVVMQARPVPSTFTTLTGITAHTSEGSFPNANYEKMFEHIQNPSDWWDFADGVLFAALYDDKYFNGDRRSAVFDGRFEHTVGEYNTLVMPVRFRQVRVNEDSCDIPKSASNLSQPCWGEFTHERQFTSEFGADYGNRYLTGLSSIQGKPGFAGNYGTSAHVVDLPLDRGLAKTALSRMNDTLWLNEQTRAISIEAAFYNANLDLSIYFRWHVDISATGRFTPSFIAYGLRLMPYGTAWDHVRLFVEILFAIMLAYYVFSEVHEARASPSLLAYFTNIWNLVEIVNLCMYVVVLVSWFSYLLVHDREPFKQVSREKYVDLLPLALHFNFMFKIASFNVIFAFVKIFKFLQIWPSCNSLWRTLALSMEDTIPFLGATLLFTCGFTFAAHWSFGLRMEAFHSRTASFSTLVRSIIYGGLPYEEMRRVSPKMAVVFLITWIFVMGIILINMCVAIITGAQASLATEVRAEEDLLDKRCGKSARLGVAGGMWQYFKSAMMKGQAGVEPTVYDADAGSRQVRKFLQQHGELREAENLRSRVLKGEKIKARDITNVFKGDVSAAMEFVQLLHWRYRGDGLPTGLDDEDDHEGSTQQELEDLTARLAGIAAHLQGATEMVKEVFAPTSGALPLEGGTTTLAAALPG